MFESREEFEEYLANPNDPRFQTPRRQTFSVWKILPVALVLAVFAGSYLLPQKTANRNSDVRLKGLKWVVSKCGVDPEKFPLTATARPIQMVSDEDQAEWRRKMEEQSEDFANRLRERNEQQMKRIMDVH